LTPTEGLGTVPWEELIAQSEQVIEDYRSWLRNAKEQSNAMQLTNSNIDALEHELKSTSDTIIETFGGGFQ
jgi:hypothetical protein